MFPSWLFYAAMVLAISFLVIKNRLYIYLLLHFGLASIISCKCTVNMFIVQGMKSSEDETKEEQQEDALQTVTL